MTYENQPITYTTSNLKIVSSQVMKIQRAWKKLRLVLFWMRFIREKRSEFAELNGRALGAEETLGCLKRP